MHTAVEQELCQQYLRKSQDEIRLDSYLSSLPDEMTVVVAQGFEERTYGVLKVLSDARVRVKRIVIARYINIEGMTT
ncbi:MAG TPA: hypothetical protein VKM93_02605 [Terriglobia bacterium]|nr:hypothetical protein [Terriglobia bacterium]